MTQVAFLADRRDTIPTLAAWFREEWPDYYAARTVSDIERDFARELNRTSLPVRLVAFENESLAGTVVLREHALDGHPQYTPALGGLLVAPAFRRRGIGTEIVRVATDLARKLNLAPLYAATATAGPLFERLAWHSVTFVERDGALVSIYLATPTTP